MESATGYPHEMDIVHAPRDNQIGRGKEKERRGRREEREGGERDEGERGGERERDRRAREAYCTAEKRVYEMQEGQIVSRSAKRDIAFWWARKKPCEEF